MNPVAILGRWVLAIITAVVTGALVVFVTLVVYAIIYHEDNAQISAHVMSMFSNAAWLGAIGGMWAGSATLPATQRKQFILWFGGLWVVCLLLYSVTQIVTGTWNNFTTFGIFGTVMGGMWVKRHLWKSPPPNFDNLWPDEQSPPSLPPPANPAATNVRPTGKSVNQGRATFGRRG